MRHFSVCHLFFSLDVEELNCSYFELQHWLKGISVCFWNCSCWFWHCTQFWTENQIMQRHRHRERERVSDCLIFRWARRTNKKPCQHHTLKLYNKLSIFIFPCAQSGNKDICHTAFGSLYVIWFVLQIYLFLLFLRFYMVCMCLEFNLSAEIPNGRIYSKWKFIA